MIVNRNQMVFFGGCRFFSGLGSSFGDRNEVLQSGSVAKSWGGGICFFVQRFKTISPEIQIFPHHGLIETMCFFQGKIKTQIFLLLCVFCLCFKPILKCRMIIYLIQASQLFL